MKHVKLIFTIIVAAASALTFTKCTEDETAEAPTKAEILKAKARELSAKYGINVTLNEENLESVADTLTVEQMEKDFQIFAALKDATIVGESEPKKKPKRNRLRIKMNKTVEEERDTDYTDSETGIRVKTLATASGKDEEGKEYEVSFQLEGTADVAWQYALKKLTRVELSLTLNTNLFTTYQGSAAFYDAKFSGGGDKSLYFTATGNISVSNGAYTLNFEASIDHQGKNTTKVELRHLK